MKEMPIKKENGVLLKKKVIKQPFIIARTIKRSVVDVEIWILTSNECIS